MDLSAESLPLLFQVSLQGNKNILFKYLLSSQAKIRLSKSGIVQIRLSSSNDFYIYLSGKLRKEFRQNLVCKTQIGGNEGSQNCEE